jgi:transcriptional regulator GlxA family with amidase domain
VVFVQSGRVVADHHGHTVMSGPGDTTVYLPTGHHAGRLAAGSRWIAVNINRRLLEDALSEALERPVRSHVDFRPAMSTAAGFGASWINMLLLLKEQLFRSDGMLARPMVGLPFVDSLVRGLLLAADHRHRDALATEPKAISSHGVRAAVDIIESEPHLPLTVTELAARTNFSVRSLQEGFRRHLGTSPMAYLRKVRLRQAHRTLQMSDPSATTVASIAYHWGFTNLGRFAAAYAARYGEKPGATLRRMEFHRDAAQ